MRKLTALVAAAAVTAFGGQAMAQLAPDDAPLEFFEQEQETLPAETAPDASETTPDAAASSLEVAPAAHAYVGAAAAIPQGPGPGTLGQVENIVPNNEIVGAMHTVATHPTNPNIHFASGVNGGIWRTTNATVGSPNWTPLTDEL